MSDTFAKLASKLVTSTVWQLDDHTRLVWITMLALKDKDHIVTASIPGLAHIARVPIESCRMAIEALQAPDIDSGSKVDEGRRIKPVENGWHIINGEKYRWFGNKLEEREAVRLRVQKHRDKIASDTALQNVTGNDVTDKQKQKQKADSEAPSNSNAEIHARAIQNFEKFWCAFPSTRKVGKQKARKAWEKAIERESAETIIQAATDYAASPLGQSSFACMPTTWLNQGRWEDDRASWQRGDDHPNGKPVKTYARQREENMQADMKKLEEMEALGQFNLFPRLTNDS